MELNRDEIHARLASLVKDEHPFAWAKRMGISKGAWTRIWNQHTVPSPELLVRIQKKTGALIDWLLTGSNDMRVLDPTADYGTGSNDDLPRPVIGKVFDETLLLEILIAVETALEQTKRQMPPLKKAELVKVLYRLHRDSCTEPVPDNILNFVRLAS